MTNFINTLVTFVIIPLILISCGPTLRIFKRVDLRTPGPHRKPIEECAQVGANGKRGVNSGGTKGAASNEGRRRARQLPIEYHGGKFSRTQTVELKTR